MSGDVTGANTGSGTSAASYALSTTSRLPFEEAVSAVRTALADNGFGVLSEIDIAATLKAKLGADIPSQLILGACRPPLAYEALQREPSIGLLLPCNVVIRTIDATHTLIEAMDPAVMVSMTGNEALAEIAAEAHERLAKAVGSVAG